jgi:hypothetical protein
MIDTASDTNETHNTINENRLLWPIGSYKNLSFYEESI